MKAVENGHLANIFLRIYRVNEEKSFNLTYNNGPVFCGAISCPRNKQVIITKTVIWNAELCFSEKTDDLSADISLLMAPKSAPKGTVTRHVSY